MPYAAKRIELGRYHYRNHAVVKNGKWWQILCLPERYETKEAAFARIDKIFGLTGFDPSGSYE